jgi:hypothetical protein
MTLQETLSVRSLRVHQGLCTFCGEQPPVEGGTQCPACLEARKRRSVSRVGPTGGRTKIYQPHARQTRVLGYQVIAGKVVPIEAEVVFDGRSDWK